MASALIFVSVVRVVLQEIWQKGLLETTGCDALHLDNGVSLSQLSTFTVDEYSSFWLLHIIFLSNEGGYDRFDRSCAGSCKEIFDFVMSMRANRISLISKPACAPVELDTWKSMR